MQQEAIRMGSPSAPMPGMWWWGQGFPGKHSSVMLKVMLFLCPAVELPLIFPTSDSLRILSRSASFFPLEMAVARNGLFSLRSASPRVREGSYFFILILQRRKSRKDQAPCWSLDHENIGYGFTLLPSSSHRAKTRVRPCHFISCYP